MSNIADMETALVEHLVVSDVINRFGRLVDDRMWNRLGALFAERVELDYTALFGGAPRVVPATAIGQIWEARLGGFDGTQHLITNIVTDIVGETATAVSNVVGVHVLSELGEDGTLIGGGTYRMRLTRIDTRWLIEAISTEVSWLRGNKDLFALAARKVGG
jgi:hypothetical protein